MSKKNGDFNWNESLMLKDYFDSKLNALKETLQMALITQKDSVGLAKDLMEKRLDSMNEFRASLKDAQMTFITRSEFEAKYESLDSKLEILQKIVYVGIGLCIAIEIMLRFIK